MRAEAIENRNVPRISFTPAGPVPSASPVPDGIGSPSLASRTSIAILKTSRPPAIDRRRARGIWVTSSSTANSAELTALAGCDQFSR